jgi:hypothetical protein
MLPFRLLSMHADSSNVDLRVATPRPLSVTRNISYECLEGFVPMAWYYVARRMVST